jgi:two-component system, NtrC family, sensor kinase
MTVPLPTLAVLWAAVATATTAVAGRVVVATGRNRKESDAERVEKLLAEKHELEASLRAARATTEVWKRQVEHGDRVATLGMAVPFIVHELNNPLLFVLTNLPRIRQLVPNEDEALAPEARAELIEALADTEQGAARLHDVTLQLRAFSGRRVDDAAEVEVRDVVRGSLQLLGSFVRMRARIEESHDPAPPVVACRVRLSQVVVNLLRNAVEAFPPGRTGNVLRISTGTAPSGDAFIVIEDNGPGIAPEALPHVFEPFFTTKSPEVGTGLGLSICRDIVERIGGRIGVDSHPGVGTSFRVLLPASGKPLVRDAQLAATSPST